MKDLLKKLRAAVRCLRALAKRVPVDLCSATDSFRKLWAWLYAVIRGDLVLGGGGCNSELNSPIVRIPDPLIYDQYYLMSLGLPYSWNNPDITIFDGGVAVDPDELQPGTTYEVVARIWNSSTNAPVAGLPVAFSYLSFGIGTQSHPIADTTVNLGVKGGPDQPAFARMPWTTPSVAGHYCIQALLEPASDANWKNNLGQQNTQVVAAHSPAVSTFQLRNDTDERQTYSFQVDAYQLPEPSPCPPADGPTPAREASLPQHLATIAATPAGQSTELPAGWEVSMLPRNPGLAPSEEISVKVTVEPPAGFSGTQAVNINALRTPLHRASGAAAFAGGVTFYVTAS